MLSIWHIIGIILTITLIIWVGVISGRKVTDAKSFTTGGTNGSWMVCGIILGTLVGGQATVGTAQLAFSFGISAWWFTLGSTLGCIFLALGYVVPLRRSGCTTLLEVVNREFGRKAETIGSMLCFLGIYISIIAQILAASAMITSLFHVKYLPAALISATLMALYVVFGGIKGAGMGGIVKLILLYVSGIASGVAVWVLSNGLHGLFSDIHLTLSNEVLMNFNDITGAEDINTSFPQLPCPRPTERHRVLPVHHTGSTFHPDLRPRRMVGTEQRKGSQRQSPLCISHNSNRSRMRHGWNVYESPLCDSSRTGSPHSSRPDYTRRHRSSAILGTGFSDIHSQPPSQLVRRHRIGNAAHYGYRRRKRTSIRSLNYTCARCIP